MHTCAAMMLTMGVKLSSGFLLWKNRIGKLFLVYTSTNRVMRPVQVISKSFSHTGTCYLPSVRVLPSLHCGKSSRKLFLSRRIAGAINSSMDHRSTHLCYHAHQHRLVTDMLATNHNDSVNNISVNCRATMQYSNIFLKHAHFQFHRGLMSDTLPASHMHNINDVLNPSHEQQTRSTPMGIEELVEFLRDENANDICVIRVPPQLDYVDYFVVCSGFGARHLRRMADGLVAEVATLWHAKIFPCMLALDC